MITATECGEPCGTRVNRSQTLVEFAKAFCKAQASMESAKKDAANPFFKSVYADLPAVSDAVKEPLNSNGISYLQSTRNDPQGVSVITLLLHTSGEWVETECWLPVSKQDAQGYGSAITYARRYGLAAAAGVVAEADDDGNAATGKTAPPKPAAKAPPLAAKPAANTDKPVPENKMLLARPAQDVREGLKNLEAKFDKVEWTKVKAMAIKLKEDEKDDDLRQLFGRVMKIANSQKAA